MVTSCVCFDPWLPGRENIPQSTVDKSSNYPRSGFGVFFPEASAIIATSSRSNTTVLLHCKTIRPKSGVDLFQWIWAQFQSHSSSLVTCGCFRVAPRRLISRNAADRRVFIWCSEPQSHSWLLSITCLLDIQQASRNRRHVPMLAAGAAVAVGNLAWPETFNSG